MFKRAARNIQRHGHAGLEPEENLSPRERARREAEERLKAAQQKFLLKTELEKARGSRNGRRILALEASIAGERLPKKLKRHVQHLQNGNGTSAPPVPAPAPTVKKRKKVRHPWCR